MVEAIDAVEEALDGHAMLVKGKELAAVVRCESPLEENAERGSVAREELMVVQIFADTLGLELLDGFADG